MSSVEITRTRKTSSALNRNVSIRSELNFPEEMYESALENGDKIQRLYALSREALAHPTRQRSLYPVRNPDGSVYRRGRRASAYRLPSALKKVADRGKAARGAALEGLKTVH